MRVAVAGAVVRELGVLEQHLAGAVHGRAPEDAVLVVVEPYELSFPSAGLTFVVGNVVEQSAETGNAILLDYASEASGMNPDTRLFVVRPAHAARCFPQR